jgi:hypothetical protein
MVGEKRAERKSVGDEGERECSEWVKVECGG